MPETGVIFTSPFKDIRARYGSRIGAPGVTIELRQLGTLAVIAARPGQRQAVREAALSGFGVNLPDLPRSVEGRGVAFIWTGPDQWLAQGPQRLKPRLAEVFSALASVVDQSHARTLLRVSGPRARDALAKGLTIDLHPRAFATGFAAATSIAHIEVVLWQTDDRPTYEFAVPRSYALSFWHWLEASASEYGLETLNFNND